MELAIKFLSFMGIAISLMTLGIPLIVANKSAEQKEAWGNVLIGMAFLFVLLGALFLLGPGWESIGTLIIAIIGIIVIVVKGIIDSRRGHA